MNTLVIPLSCAGLLLALASWILYLAAIPRGRVPARPYGHIVLQALSVLLSAAAFLLWFQERGVSAALLAPAGLGLMLATTFLLLLSQRKTPIGAIAVGVGSPLLPFEALTSTGSRFHTDALTGQRVLLKFFRGHW